ncbi:MAG: M15 family metallopeptidase [Bacteroidota bacterium]
MKKEEILFLSPATYSVLLLFLIGIFFFSCTNNNTPEKKFAEKTSEFSFYIPALKTAPSPPPFADSSMCDIQTLDSSIHVHLVYSTTENFIGKDVYGDLERAYLRKEIAYKIVTAQKKLKSIEPSYSLLILDAARPHHVQQTMWDAVKGTDKRRYVAYPGNNSNHNYGAAVDLTIMDTRSGKQLDMGTPFDCFEELAWPLNEVKFLQEGKLTQKQVENRKLLRNCMRQGGFGYSVHEWWHFNGFRDSVIRVLYPVIP